MKPAGPTETPAPLTLLWLPLALLPFVSCGSVPTGKDIDWHLRRRKAGIEKSYEFLTSPDPLRRHSLATTISLGTKKLAGDPDYRSKLAEQAPTERLTRLHRDPGELPRILPRVGSFEERFLPLLRGSSLANEGRRLERFRKSLERLSLLVQTRRR